MPKLKTNIRLKETYLTAIKNSVGSKLFQSVYVVFNGKKIDVTEKGTFSCAHFVSWILHHFNLIHECHVTINGLEKDMERSGWKRIVRPRIGAVLVWEHIMDVDDEPHRHIGFYVGNARAISNSTKMRVPRLHHWTFGNAGGKAKRNVEAVYWHEKLN